MSPILARLRAIMTPMARLPRYVVPGQPQHVIQRGNNRSPVFLGTLDFQFFLRCLLTACQKHGCLIHAYVLMTNHFHLVMTPINAVGIGRALQAVGRRYVRHFNDVHGRSGTLWEGRYRATLIDTARYLLVCQRYVELNPVRAGLSEQPEEYPWSSYQANAMGVRDPLVTPHRLYLALATNADRRLDTYRSLFQTPLDQSSMKQIREATNKGWALGEKDAFEGGRVVVNRRTKPLPAGRPRRETPANY